jgi:ketosteroid isomerase-like protein
MNTNEQFINKFYEAFAQKDYHTMAECYHPDATFKDEAFDLDGRKQIGSMWRMLIERGTDLKIEFSNVQANDSTGKAHWEAWYTFSQTGNSVHNIIDANFTFKDGKIFNHRDSFDFHRWASQSLGITGKLLGWTGFLHQKVRATAMSGLENYMARKEL